MTAPTLADLEALVEALGDMSYACGKASVRAGRADFDAAMAKERTARTTLLSAIASLHADRARLAAGLVEACDIYGRLFAAHNTLLESAGLIMSGGEPRIIELRALAASRALATGPAALTVGAEARGPIWLVTGSCGEYSDRQDWTVCWFPTEEQAKAHAAACQAEDAAIEGDARYEWRYQPDRQAPVKLDPHWRTDYTGTFYGVECVEPGPRGPLDARREP